MTKVLLDTNIIIHRENNRVSNYSIGYLYRWLDKLKLTKVIHPLTEKELNRYNNEDYQAALAVKLQSYEKFILPFLLQQNFTLVCKTFQKNRKRQGR